MSLRNKMEKWISSGLISQTQAEAILKYEKNGKSKTIRGSRGFLVVAACSAGLGVIALIAANWKVIPIYVKLAGYFALLISVGSSILITRLKNKSGFLFESLSIFFVVLCLAGFGLISQIYNIEGESYKNLFLWSFITFFLILLSDKRLILHIWFSGFYLAFSIWTLDIIGDSEVPFKASLLLPLFFLGSAMTLYNKKIEKTTFFYLLLPKRKALMEWAVFTGFVSLIYFNVLSLESNPDKVFVTFLELVFLSLLGGFVFLAIRFSSYKKIQKKLLSHTLILFLLFYIMVFSMLELNSLIVTLISVLLLSLPAFCCATLKQRKLFGLFIFAIIVRLFIFSMEIYVSLMLTGLILIFLAWLIFTAVQLVKKNEKQLLQWLEALE